MVVGRIHYSLYSLGRRTDLSDQLSVGGPVPRRTLNTLGAGAERSFEHGGARSSLLVPWPTPLGARGRDAPLRAGPRPTAALAPVDPVPPSSAEHTSELQSRPQ